MDMGRGEERVRRMERVTRKHITICKIDSQGEFAVWLRKLKQVQTYCLLKSTVIWTFLAVSSG